jgi:transglutaminase superfamily protein
MTYYRGPFARYNRTLTPFDESAQVMAAESRLPWLAMRPIRKLRWLWRRFRSQPWGKRSLLLEAAFWIVAARLAILLVPFSRIARHMGGMRQPEPACAQFIAGQTSARDVSWAIGRVAPVLPFKVVCLPRALAAWQMLRRRGVAARLHFGIVRTNPNQRQAHAWLDSSGVEVCGYPEAFDCVEIGFFAGPV